MSGDLWIGADDDPDRIRMGAPVASGSEGVLYRAYVERPIGTEQIAVKMLQPGHLDQLDQWTARWRDQVDLLRRVEAPGLVSVLGGFVGPLPHSRGNANNDTSSLYLLMEWVEGVALDRWVQRLEAAEPERLLQALLPVATALDLLHSGVATGGIPVLHGDVKPGNILIGPDGESVLVDVGSVRGMTGDSVASGAGGTIGYIAPEVRATGRYAPPADRYSLGAVAYFMLAGEEPPETGLEELRDRLLAAPLINGRGDLVDHIVAMLDPDPTQRPAFLANWVAQLRRSSLVTLPGGQPRAPGRNPAGTLTGGHSPADTKAASGGGSRWRNLRTAALLVLVAVLAVVVVVDRRPEPAGSASPGTGFAGPTSSVAAVSEGPAQTPSTTVEAAADRPASVISVAVSSPPPEPVGKASEPLVTSRGPVDAAPRSPGPRNRADVAGKIAFVRVAGQETQIMLMNVDGSGQTLLTDVPNASDLRWSPDGTKLAYSTSQRVVIFNTDGSGVVTLPGEAKQPTWSPDGMRLAFARVDTDTTNVYVMGVDGSGVRRVAAGGYRPSWSPDGRRIAFSRFAPDGFDIYTVAPDGSALTQVTNLGGYAGMPVWAPDGSTIAFRHNTGLSIVSADGNGARSIVFPPGGPGEPSWSPDSHTVAFRLHRGDSDCSIAAVNRDGSGYRLLTNNGTCDQDPAWNPIR